MINTLRFVRERVCVRPVSPDSNLSGVETLIAVGIGDDASPAYTSSSLLQPVGVRRERGILSQLSSCINK